MVERLKLPFVFRWQLELSEQRRIADREQQDRTIESLREQMRELRTTDAQQYHAQLDIERERVKDWKSIATTNATQLHDLQEKYHALAIDPPNGIMKGPTNIDPFEGFPEKTKATLRAQTQGRPRDIVDTIVKRTRLIQTTHPQITDEQLSERVRRGDYSG